MNNTKIGNVILATVKHNETPFTKIVNIIGVEVNEYAIVINGHLTNGAPVHYRIRIEEIAFSLPGGSNIDNLRHAR